MYQISQLSELLQNDSCRLETQEGKNGSLNVSFIIPRVLKKTIDCQGSLNQVKTSGPVIVIESEGKVGLIAVSLRRENPAGNIRPAEYPGR